MKEHSVKIIFIKYWRHQNFLVLIFDSDSSQIRFAAHKRKIFDIPQASLTDSGKSRLTNDITFHLL